MLGMNRTELRYVLTSPKESSQKASVGVGPWNALVYEQFQRPSDPQRVQLGNTTTTTTVPPSPATLPPKQVF